MSQTKCTPLPYNFAHQDVFSNVWGALVRYPTSHKLGHKNWFIKNRLITDPVRPKHNIMHRASSANEGELWTVGNWNFHRYVCANQLQRETYPKNARYPRVSIICNHLVHSSSRLDILWLDYARRVQSSDARPRVGVVLCAMWTLFNGCLRTQILVRRWKDTHLSRKHGVES